MAWFEQLGRPKQVAITTPAVTVTDILDADLDFDIGELFKNYSGDDRYPRITLGNDNSSISFKTTDMAAFMALIKGIECATVVLTFEAPMSTPTAGSIAVTAQHAKILTVTLSLGRVAESIKLKAAADGKPAEFEIKIIPCCKESDGTKPTLTFALAAP